jgi:hypothetical protein
MSSGTGTTFTKLRSITHCCQTKVAQSASPQVPAQDIAAVQSMPSWHASLNQQFYWPTLTGRIGSTQVTSAGPMGVSTVPSTVGKNSRTAS